MAGNPKTVDMTKGSIRGHLIRFTIPLILGNIFQLAYNFVDTLVVGRFAGSAALAAVGTSDPIMNLLILGVSGVCIGASVLMSNFFGAGETDRLKDEMKITVLLGLIAAAVVMTVGLCLWAPILRLLRVPDAIFGDAGCYLRVIFLGMPFTCLYNIYAAALRSVGDSKTPLHYLMLSMGLNMGLDVILVAGFHMGVLGAGLATVLSQAVSAVLCIFHVSRHVPVLHMDLRDLSIDRELAGRTLSYGGLTALQQCSQPLGNLIIQGTVNTLGVSAIAAFNAAKKVEDIGMVPGRSLSTSIMTFTAQNEGAGDHERTEQGFRAGILLEVSVALLIGGVLLLLKTPFMQLFTRDSGIIQAGVAYLSVMGCIFFLPSLTNGHQGFFRGVGKMKIVLYGTLTQITIRTLSSLYFIPRYGIIGVAVGSAAGWIVMLLWQVPYRIRLSRRMRSGV